MAQKILLENNPYHITENKLPCLITYGEKTGGSHFSITMVADLFLSGSKILFLTAYPMAKENFMEQAKGFEFKISYVTNADQLDVSHQVIILESGNEDLFMRAIQTLPDLSERVVLVKNMEVFSDEVLAACVSMNKIILSGNIDTCVAKEKIATKEYQTIIAFTKPEIAFPVSVPELEKYIGYLWSGDTQGIVKTVS